MTIEWHCRYTGSWYWLLVLHPTYEAKEDGSIYVLILCKAPCAVVAYVQPVLIGVKVDSRH